MKIFVQNEMVQKGCIDNSKRFISNDICAVKGSYFFAFLFFFLFLTSLTMDTMELETRTGCVDFLPTTIDVKNGNSGMLS